MLHFLDPAVHLAYLAVTSLAAALHPIGGDASAALAIVVFTLAVKLCLSPLTLAAARAERSRAALSPRLAELRARFRKDPALLAAEVRRLHEQEAVRPLAGCLPMLLQMPVLSVVYRLFLVGTVAGQPNTLLAATLFGAPLGSPWPTSVAVFGAISGPGLVAAVTVALLIAVAALASRQMRRRVAAVGAAGAGGAAEAPGASGAVGAAGTIGRLMPFATVAFAAVVPLATAVYLLTSTAWTVAERAALTRLLS